MNGKIFFLDLDYTVLCDDGSVAEETVEAVSDALDGGDCIAISTGRPPVSAMPAARSLGMLRKNCFLIAFNGAVIYDLETGSILRNLRMPDEYASYLFSEAGKYGIYMQAYDDKEFITSKVCPETEYYSGTIGIPYRVVPDLYGLKVYNTPKVLALALDDQEPLRNFQRDHLEWEKGKCVSYFSRPVMLEYSYIKATKASAVAFFEQYLDIPHENTIAVGDAENDIPMIRASGIGAVMKNASERVKNCAGYITERDNNEGGAAEVIKKFGSGNIKKMLD